MMIFNHGFFDFYCTVYVAFVVFWTLLMQISGNPCPIDWQLIDDVCFQYSKETKVTWSKAEELCRTRYNSELIVLNKNSVYSKIKDHVSATGAVYWVGAKRERGQDTYNWIDGTSLSSDNPFWLHHEPSKRREKCVMLWKTNDTLNGLNDAWCGEQHAYMCQGSGDGCDEDWHRINDTCFQLRNNQISNWYDAESDCKKNGSGLVVIKENLWSVEEIARRYYGDRSWLFWVGAQFDEKSNFKWTDGSIVSLSLWRPGEPNGHEHCVDIWRHPKTAATGLNDAECDYPYSFICEMKDSFVRLVDGETYNDGRLEIFHNNEWGTVCDDYFDRNAAIVVCRMLGLPSSGAYATGLSWGVSNSTIWLDDVRCNGTETSIELCDHLPWGTHNCQHDEDISVICNEAIKGARVVDEYGPYAGRVQVYLNNTWSSVCYSSWGSMETKVLCQTLGMDNASQVQVFPVNHRQEIKYVAIKHLICDRTATSLEHCVYSGSFQSSCDLTLQLGVYCAPECPLIKNCKKQTCIEKDTSVCNECEDNFTMTTDERLCQLIQQQPCPTVDTVFLVIGSVCAAFLLIIIAISLWLCLQRCKSRGIPTPNNDQITMVQQTPSTHITGLDEATRECRNASSEESDPSAMQGDYNYDMPNMYMELQNRNNTEHLYGLT